MFQEKQRQFLLLLPFQVRDFVLPSNTHGPRSVAWHNGVVQTTKYYYQNNKYVPRLKTKMNTNRYYDKPTNTGIYAGETHYLSFLP